MVCLFSAVNASLYKSNSVNVIVTEQGVADLRGKSPSQRAKTIIDNCVHPDYKEILRDYIRLSGKGQTPQTLAAALGMHDTLAKKGDMRLVDWNDYK